MDMVLESLLEGDDAWTLPERCYGRIDGRITANCPFPTRQESHTGLGSSNTRLSDCLGILVAAGLCISHSVCWNTCMEMYQCTLTKEQCTLLMLQAAV